MNVLAICTLLAISGEYNSEYTQVSLKLKRKVVMNLSAQKSPHLVELDWLGSK